MKSHEWDSGFQAVCIEFISNYRRLTIGPDEVNKSDFVTLEPLKFKLN